jgi:cell wall-associated NlpC family hydrolase
MIPAWAADYVGIPFREHGRSRDGADCWGLYWLSRRFS